MMLISSTYCVLSTCQPTPAIPIAWSNEMMENAEIAMGTTSSDTDPCAIIETEPPSREVQPVDMFRDQPIETANLNVSATPLSGVVSPPENFDADQPDDANTAADRGLPNTPQPSSPPYSSFSKSTKWMIVGLGGIAGIFSPIS